MRIKVVLLLAALSGLIYLSLHSRRTTSIPPLRQTPGMPEAAASGAQTDLSSTPSPLPHEPSHAATTAGPLPGTPPATAITAASAANDQNTQGDQPAFTRFNRWVTRYLAAASAADKSGLEADGVAMAADRLHALADLIQGDPERAIALAIPDDIRRRLPSAVAALIENRIQQAGDYEVVCVTPRPAPGRFPLAPLVRLATIDGAVHRVFTYGRALDYLTRANMPMSGIAVPMAAVAHPPGDATGREPTYLMAMSALTDGSDAGFDTPATPGNLPTAASGYTEGRKRYLLMRVDFADYAGDVFPTNNALTHMRDMSNFLAEISYNKHIIAPVGKGSDITPVMRMSRPVSSYDNKGLSDLYPEARTVAQNVFGYDLSQYDFFFVCTGGKPAFGYAGLGYVGGVGYHLANSYFDVRTSAHELGHNLGLGHANWWDTGDRSAIGPGNNEEYGDPFDTMGGSGGGIRHFSASQKNRLDWIPAEDAITVSRSGVYRLHAHDIVTAPYGVRAIRLNRRSGNPYWLEFRQLWTSNKGLMNGVNFRWAGGSSQLLDMTAGSSGGKDDHSLTIGRTFSDFENNIHVTPVRKGNTYPESLDLEIQFGSFPANVPPVAVAAASASSAGIGQTITFTATATDANGDALAYYWDFGDGDYSVDNSATTTHSFSAAGEYHVEVMVSDMKGGLASDSVTVTVGNPTTYAISGHVLNHDGRPLPGIRVSTDGSHYAFSESDGSYAITRLAAGNYNVAAIDSIADAYRFANPFFNNPVTVGPDVTGADFIVSTNPPALLTSIIAPNSSWKYLDNGSNQGTAWKAPSFNDAAWTSGNGVLGYTDGNDQIDTTISFGPDSANKYITYYFRRAFTVANPAAFTGLRLRVRRDDGVIVYLNGNEIFRDNMPAGTPTYTTTASSALEPNTYLEQELSTSGLLAGNNLIAAEIHQANSSSSDVAFDLAFDGVTATNGGAYNVAYLTTPSANRTLVNPASVTLAAAALGTSTAATRAEFFVDGLKIGEDTTAPFSFVWTSPTIGTHQLTVVATFGTATASSAPTTIHIAAAPSLAVTLMEPAAEQDYELPASVSLSASASAGPAPVASVKFLVDGALLSQDTTAPYSATLLESSVSSKQVVAVATDTLGNTATSAPVTLHFAEPAAGDQLVSFGDTWKYLDDGSNQGVAWRAPTFDDRRWAAGTARLGYGGDGEVTLVSYGGNAARRYVTTYFRRAFPVPDPARYRGLLLQLQRDDGAVVYLNGVEFMRDNLPSGPVSWNSFADTAIDGAAETTPVEKVIPASALVAGTNVIAVEMHQAAIDSSDLGFALALVGLNVAAPADGIYLTQPGAGASFNTPAHIALAAYASAGGGAPQSVQYHANSLWVGTGSATPPYGFTWSNAPVGAHRLTAVVFRPGGSSTSAPIDVTVGRALPLIQPLTSTLVSQSGPWRYWDSSISVGPGWQTRDFSDTDWQVGNARLGWGLDGENTTITDGRITHYFRRWFNAAAPALYGELSFQLARDDGAVVYLNGAEVFRSNMPEGVITPTTPALTTVNAPEETTYFEYDFSTTGSGIVAGTNLIAVELHQSSATSSDGGFDLQLLAYGSSAGRVYLTKPLRGTTYSGSSTVEVEAIARGAGNSAVTKIQFLVDGELLGERIGAPWTLAWTNAPLGVHQLTARSFDTLGFITESEPMELAIGREPVTTTLIPVSSTWRYLDTGANLGTNWTRLTYPDANWKSGQARLGYGGDGETLPAVSYGGNSASKYITTYFRRTFAVPPGAVYTNLTFRLLRDDGAVVWLNGAELYRSNMPEAPTEISYLTLSSTSVSGADEQTFFVTTLPATELVEGTNVVAVEIHQQAPDSSDLGFNLELTASGYEDPQTPPALVVDYADDLVELRWPATAVGWQVYSAAAIDAPANAWTPAVGSLIQASGQNIFTLVPVDGKRFFRLRK